MFKTSSINKYAKEKGYLPDLSLFKASHADGCPRTVWAIRGMWEGKHLKILFLHISIYRIHFNKIINLNKTSKLAKEFFCQRKLCGMQGRIGFVRGDFFLQTFFVWQTKKVDDNLTENALGLAIKVPMYSNNRKNNGSIRTT